MLIGIVDSLPDFIRLPVWLHYCEGFNRCEIGEIMSVSLRDVDRLLSRGSGEVGRMLELTGRGRNVRMSATSLMSMCRERAPESLLWKIDSIVKGDGRVLPVHRGKRMRGKGGRTGRGRERNGLQLKGSSATYRGEMRGND
ncbi:MAG: hypothetical protein C0404_02420 [Verrucomicrobia bacterium]|nr:hypothetical protein [Verrucomicrobiota bacterium]